MPKKLNDESVRGWLKGRTGWKKKGETLIKEFRFSSFRDSIVFVNRLAGIADQMGHHPEIDIRYDLVRVILTTREAKGLTDADLKAAEQIDFATSVR